MNIAGRDYRFPPPTKQEAARVELLATALLRTIDDFGAETGDLTICDAANALLTCLVRTVKSATPESHKLLSDQILTGLPRLLRPRRATTATRGPAHEAD